MGLTVTYLISRAQTKGDPWELDALLGILIVVSSCFLVYALGVLAITVWHYLHAVEVLPGEWYFRFWPHEQIAQASGITVRVRESAGTVNVKCRAQFREDNVVFIAKIPAGSNGTFILEFPQQKVDLESDPNEGDVVWLVVSAWPSWWRGGLSERIQMAKIGVTDHRPAPIAVTPEPVREGSALAIECRTESGLRLGDERAALAYLVVRSVNQGQIQNAYVKVHRILEHTFQNINKEWRPYTQPLYEHEDIFLKWQATEERYHSFHSEAVLNVARGRRGDGRYGLVSHAPNLIPGLQIYDWYEITLDIAADNSPLLQRTLILRMEEPIVEMGGKSVLFPDSPYRIEFREKETGEIMPPPKLDTGESQPQ